MSKKKIIIKAFLTAFCSFFLAALSNAESCSTAGQTQNKYTAGQPDDCSYTTQTRTCCSNGSWSSWGGSCPTVKTCDSASKPNAVEDYGDCCQRKRTVTCNTSTGLWETGSWGSATRAYKLHTICCNGTSGYTVCKASCSWNNRIACGGNSETYQGCEDQFIKEPIAALDI